MKMDREAFLAWENKAITLLGMSGVGKTTLARKLPRSHWFHYSGDYRIGTKYLQEPILDNIKKKAMQVSYLRDLLRSDSIYIASNITIHNLDPISAFLGKVGDPALGGLPLGEFKERQRLHYEAEIAAMRDVEAFITKGREIYQYQHFINDAGGSICELEDGACIEALAEHTLIVYIRAGEGMEEKLIQRHRDSPKPLYYQEEFLQQALAEYRRIHGLESETQIEPDDFAQWTFPRLVAHRRPLYQALADRYGYTVTATDVEKVADEDDFLRLVGESLGAADAA